MSARHDLNKKFSIIAIIFAICVGFFTQSLTAAVVTLIAISVLMAYFKIFR